MPHKIQGLTGSSLVPDFSQALNLGLQIPGAIQQADERARIASNREEASGLIDQLGKPDLSSGQEQKALLRLSQVLDPQQFQSVQSVVHNANLQELEDSQKQLDDALKFALSIEGLPHEEQINLINAEFKRLSALKVSLPPDQQDNIQGLMDELAKLGQKNKGQLDNAIFKQKIISVDTKTALKFAKARRERQEIAKKEEIDRVARDSFQVSQLPVEQQAPFLINKIFEGEQRGENVDHLKVLQRLSPENRATQAQANVNRARKPEDIFKPDAGFTLSQGQTRFGPGGQEIANLPDKSAAAKPASEVAKLNQDLAQGLITPEQFNESVAAIKEKQKTSLIKNLESAGVDLNTEEGKALAIKAILKPRVKIDINKENEGLFKTPKNYMLLDQDDPTKGVTPIPGGPADSLKGELAGKTAMLRTSQTAAKGIRALVFDKEGNVDRINLINAAMNTPFTKGRELRTKMEFGIQAITRLETGAAMPPSEVENTRTRFMPRVGDSKKVINIKLKMFDEFVNGTLKLIDPTGRFNAERFQAELESRSGGESGKNTSEMTDEQLLSDF